MSKLTTNGSSVPLTTAAASLSTESYSSAFLTISITSTWIFPLPGLTGRSNDRRTSCLQTSVSALFGTDASNVGGSLAAPHSLRFPLQSAVWNANRTDDGDSFDP